MAEGELEYAYPILALKGWGRESRRDELKGTGQLATIFPSVVHGYVNHFTFWRKAGISRRDFVYK